MRIYRFLRRFAVVASLGAAVIAGTMTSAAAETKVRLGTVAWIGYAPFYVAVERGLFSKYGVKVELQDFPDRLTRPRCGVGGLSHPSL